MLGTFLIIRPAGLQIQVQAWLWDGCINDMMDPIHRFTKACQEQGHEGWSDMGLLDEWVCLEGRFAVMRPRGRIESIRLDHGFVAAVIFNAAMELAFQPRGCTSPVRGANPAEANCIQIVRTDKEAA